MRYDNNIETIHHLSSWRATTTARLHRGVNSSGNTSRYDRHLKVGLMAGQQPLGVSQTLKVSRAEKTEFANCPTLPRESFAWVSVNPKLTNHTMQSCGSDFLSNLNTSRFQKHLKVSATTTNQSLGVSQTLKVSRSEKTEFANCRLNLPIYAFKLPIDGLNCRLLHLDCQLSHLDCQLSAQTTRGAVNIEVLEKLTDAGEFALPPVSASLRTTELAAAWSMCNNHAIQSRGSDGSSDFMEKKRSYYETSTLFQNKEMEYEHFSSSQEEYIRQLAGGRWCLNTISAPPHRCKRGTPLLEEGKLELAASSSKHTATLLTIKYNNPQSKYWDDRVVNSNFIPDPSPCRELPLQGKPVLNRAGAHPTCSFVGSKLFPLKKGKWLQPKGSGAELIEKNAHLSVWKTMGTGDNKLNPFFLISNLATALPKFRDYRVGNRINKPHDAIVRQQRDSHWNANVLPLKGEVSASWRTEGYIVANTNKSSAYET